MAIDRACPESGISREWGWVDLLWGDGKQGWGREGSGKGGLVASSYIFSLEVAFHKWKQAGVLAHPSVDILETLLWSSYTASLPQAVPLSSVSGC